MKTKLFFVILFSVFSLAGKTNGWLIKKEFTDSATGNIPRQIFAKAMEGYTEYLASGKTDADYELFIDGFIRAINNYRGSGSDNVNAPLQYNVDGRTTAAVRLKGAREIEIPAGTEIVEYYLTASYFRGREMAARARLSQPGEKFLASKKGKLWATLRGGNPVYCEKQFPEAPQPPPADTTQSQSGNTSGGAAQVIYVYGDYNVYDDQNRNDNNNDNNYGRGSYRIDPLPGPNFVNNRVEDPWVYSYSSSGRSIYYDPWLSGGYVGARVSIDSSPLPGTHFVNNDCGNVYSSPLPGKHFVNNDCNMTTTKVFYTPRKQ